MVAFQPQVMKNLVSISYGLRMGVLSIAFFDRASFSSCSVDHQLRGKTRSPWPFESSEEVEVPFLIRGITNLRKELGHRQLQKHQTLY